MIDEINFRCYGEDLSGSLRAVVTGSYNGFIIRKEFYVLKDENFKSNGEALLKDAKECIIKEIMSHEGYKGKV